MSTTGGVQGHTKNVTFGGSKNYSTSKVNENWAKKLIQQYGGLFNVPEMPTKGTAYRS